MIAPPAPSVVESDVRRALEEDIGSGDVSADLLPDVPATAFVVCRQDAVVAGRPWFEGVFRRLDPQVDIRWRCVEGEAVGAGSVLCTLGGRARALLSGERSALNFLQTLSSTATATAAYVAAVAGTRARVLDTRKTLPGLRLAQKYAVRAGGGDNHRIGLFDAVMLKENHIHAAGSITAAMAAARARHPGVPVIVEVEDFQELREALACRPERILLDEFTLPMMREAVALVAGAVPLEASGSVDLDRIAAVAATGVDCISVGALTKHISAVDLSMRLGQPPQ